MVAAALSRKGMLQQNTCFDIINDGTSSYDFKWRVLFMSVGLCKAWSSHRFFYSWAPFFHGIFLSLQRPLLFLKQFSLAILSLVADLFTILIQVFTLSWSILVLFLPPHKSLKYLHYIHIFRIINIYIYHKIQFNLISKVPCNIIAVTTWISALVPTTFLDFFLFIYFVLFNNFSSSAWSGISKISQWKYRIFVYAYPINAESR